MIDELIKGNRSYRRFHQETPVSMETLKGLVNLARLSASAANLQPLKFFLSCEPGKNAGIFSCLAWAGYLEGWPGPAEGERPAAYIVILGDTGISKNFGCDHGIAAQSILLGARDRGLGGCMLGSIQRDRLRGLLNLPEILDILLVIALGRPKETVVLEEVSPGGDIKYWRDGQGIHHVPKRRLEDIILS
ncbi:MAG: nitroreductase family protein [Deltaproteobacteria bacterium]|nr:nitroreductase family protein [Deltaproteobacteria bacterium]